MAVTVDPITNGDFVRINRADALTGWSIDGAWSMGLLNTASQVENTGCIEARVNAGIGSATANFTSRSFENIHLRHWIKLAQSISSIATYGARIIIGVDGIGGGNHGSIAVYGESKQVPVYNGWLMLVADPRKPYTSIAGTPPSDIVAVTDAGSRVDFVDGNGKSLAVFDMFWVGNEVSIEGGTTGARGKFSEWATSDRSSGFGILRPVGGVYYLNAGAVFQPQGGAGGVSNYFEDSNTVIIFEDLPVSGSIYKFRHVGEVTGTNSFQLGTLSGTGINEEGSSGGVIRAAGGAPFRIEAIDANINLAGYYGVTMLGPSTFYKDQPRNIKRYDSNADAFTDITANANGGPGRTDAPYFTNPQRVGDIAYFGHDERFYTLNLNLSLGKGAADWTGVWEYYNGTAWVSLTDLTDGTTNMITVGANAVNWAIPDDWASNAINSDTRYWVRFRISSVTTTGIISPTQESNTDGVTVDMAGDIRLENANAKIIGSALSGMGSIRVRNGAFIKKCVINSSNTGSKHGAIDLGSTDPTSNTVRDLTIQNCTRGILLKGTSTGTTDYNFRNIKFSNNTFDVRVDFPAGATININVLESGSSPTIDNVNGSTVNIVTAPAVTTIKVIDFKTGLPIQNARVWLHDNPITVHIFTVQGTLTDVNGEVTDSRVLASPLPVTGWVRYPVGTTIYKTSPISGTIDTISGFVTTIQMIED